MAFKLPSIDIEQIVKSINLQEATNLVVETYHQQGYNGDFGSTAKFTVGVSADNCVCFNIGANQNFPLNTCI